MRSLNDFVEVKVTKNRVLLAVQAVGVCEVRADVVMRLGARRAKGQTIMRQITGVVGSGTVANLIAFVAVKLGVKLVHLNLLVSFLLVAVLSILTALNFKGQTLC